VIEPQRAPVRPRVLSPSSGESVLLEDEILSLVERNARGLVWLIGGLGSGKTTALAHLAAVLPDSARVILRDDDQWQPAVPDRLMIRCGRAGTAPKNALASYQLAPWTDDEIVEYVLAVHRDRCESIMRRCSLGNDKEILRGNPELWRHVLDVLAADERIVTIRAGLRQVVDSQLPAGTARELASNWCLAILLRDAKLGAKYRCRLERVCDFSKLLRLLWHVPVLLLLAAERIADELRSGKSCPVLEHVLVRELVAECAPLIRNDQTALNRLKGIMLSRSREMQPTAASLLHAANVGWRPEPTGNSGWQTMFHSLRDVLPRLHGAYLQCAAWDRAILSGMDVSDADLSGAVLTGANLDDATATCVNLRNAKLAGASLERVNAEGACLASAELSCVHASKGRFQSVDAQLACFEGAMLKNASFIGAKLSGARFVRSNLVGADLFSAEIEGADFSQAELQGARLDGLVLHSAEFRNCSFRGAYLSGCDLEGMVLPGVDFQRANLKGALLTDSVMPRANFRYAKLVNTGLAEIEWEHADLRRADLRGASFHMGSSRSGLLESPIASLGTRTGFYTDDYNEQDFKSPEEIRKANLRGADLRGANISGVDFYLVDLRDALYDASQEQQLRSTGAILESRVP
jgi:uncharacterized protein YjbI with pentapeptide repeats